MKNKIQKILIVMIALITVSTSNVQAGETYAGRGAWIGAVAGGVTLGSVVGYKLSQQSSGFSDCSDEPGCISGEGLVVIATLGGAAIGSGLGAIIGHFIPKNKNISVTPTFDPTPGTVGGGLNLAVKF